MMTTTEAVKERQILFSGEMVRAILDGRKSQTRRVIKPQPEGRLPICITNGRKLMLSGEVVENVHCPYGKPGDRLWVRETWNADAEEVLFNDAYTGPDHYFHQLPSRLRTRGNTDLIYYRADGRSYAVGHADDEYRYEDLTPFEYYEGEDLPPKWIPSIYMPRWACRLVLDVTDVRVERLQDISGKDAYAEGIKAEWFDEGAALLEFEALWDQINGKRPGCAWDDNLWLWVVSFKPTEAQPC